MLLMVAVLLAALTVPLAGGRLSALAEARLRQAWALPVALALQLAAIYAPSLPQQVRIAALVASYPVGGLLVLANRRLPGMLLIGLGAAGNVTAMLANGGVMPASPEALAGAGLPVEPEGFSNSQAVASPRLLFLGDVFYLPAPRPLGNVFSAGDVLIVLGAAWMLHRLGGSRLAAWRPRRARGAAGGS